MQEGFGLKTLQQHSVAHRDFDEEFYRSPELSISVEVVELQFSFAGLLGGEDKGSGLLDPLSAHFAPSAPLDSCIYQLSMENNGSLKLS